MATAVTEQGQADEAAPSAGARRGFLLPRSSLITLLVGVAIYTVFGLYVAKTGNGYHQTVLALGLSNVVLAVGFSIVYTQSGQFSFATFGFYAVGGFAYAWFAKHVAPELAMVLATVMAGFVGFVVRLATARLSRLYFAIASLAVGALILIVFNNWHGVSGGSQGIGPVKAMTFGLVNRHHHAALVLEVAWVVSAAAVLVAGLLYRSAWSRDLLIVRDMRLVGRNDGIPVRRREVEAFVVGAAFTGLAGALLADTNVFISVDSFGVTVALQALIMVVLGGGGGVLGPIIGAAVLTELPELLRSAAKGSGLVYGILLLVVFIVLPEGVMGLWDKAAAKVGLTRRQERR
jgi:ABC-type branched-subunit amino acid transport system permease subunit